VEQHHFTAQAVKHHQLPQAATSLKKRRLKPQKAGEIQ